MRVQYRFRLVLVSLALTGLSLTSNYAAGYNKGPKRFEKRSIDNQGSCTRGHGGDHCRKHRRKIEQKQKQQQAIVNIIGSSITNGTATSTPSAFALSHKQR